MSAAMAAKRVSFFSSLMVVSGRAVAVTVLPTAMPMRLVPKSNASSVPDGMEGFMPSGMSGLIGQRGEIDAEQSHRGRQPLLGGQVEQDVLVGRHAEPGVIGEFLFQLPFRPAGVTQGHQHVLRPLAFADRLEDILGGGKADMLVDMK